jgi:hypothetical protein
MKGAAIILIKAKLSIDEFLLTVFEKILVSIGSAIKGTFAYIWEQGEKFLDNTFIGNQIQIEMIKLRQGLDDIFNNIIMGYFGSILGELENPLIKTLFKGVDKITGAEDSLGWIEKYFLDIESKHTERAKINDEMLKQLENKDAETRKQGEEIQTQILKINGEEREVTRRQFDKIFDAEQSRIRKEREMERKAEDEINKKIMDKMDEQFDATVESGVGVATVINSSSNAMTNAIIAALSQVAQAASSNSKSSANINNDPNFSMRLRNKEFQPIRS